ncbi:ABC transporter permease [Gracilibacillus alcaliphilus]|uniref:ABC transporter permease n=1 Tax=Gracilibacillus alcaliphilus TaxID=1401441 RepID=UPI00195C4B59|nr:ABC transporter permease subunit [Gracilibacillus alcaliphilus]MBM7676530.1 putative spermidine/putrescine transport system permease protein [Gracilibacillus alcaliphilus]
MKGTKWHIIVSVVLAIYLVLPLVGTLLYSLAGEWSTTILPKSWTFEWYIQLFQDDRFFQALGRTVFVIAVAVILSIAVILLATITIVLYFPKWEGALKTIALLPYSVPGVALAVGLINLYANDVVNIAGTPWILFGIYAIIIMPFVYQGIRNSLYTINARDMIQAAELLGASKLQAVITVVLPNMKKGIFSAAFLAISMLFGEFALANLLVGGRFETLQIYLYQQLSKNGHLTSAIVICYYTIIVWITLFLLYLQSPKRQKQTRAIKQEMPISAMQNANLEGE